MMGLFKPEEAEASASGTALRKAMTKKEIEAYNTVPTRSELPVDKAYSPELKDPKKYNAAVKEQKKKQAVIDQAALDYKARMDAAKAVENSQVKVPAYTDTPNMQEAMNPTTSRNAQKRLEAANIRAGGKESVSGSQNNIMSAAESARIAEQVNDVADRFNVDEFDKRVTVPELEAIKKKYAEQIAGLDQEQDKTGDLISILAASGKDPSKIDLNKFYKFDAKDKATALRDKLRALTNDQSKALGDTAKLKLTAFAAMKLPNTNFSTSAAQQLPPAPKGGGKGGKGEGYKLSEKTVKELADLDAMDLRLDETLKYIKNNPEKMGRLSQGLTEGAKIFGFESASSEIDNLLTSIKQDIGKAKEGGVLREADERKYNRLLPSVGTNPETAIKNLLLIQQELRQKTAAYKASLKSTGYKIDGLMVPPVTTPPTIPGAAPKSGSGLSDAEKKRKEEIKLLLGKP